MPGVFAKGKFSLLRMKGKFSLRARVYLDAVDRYTISSKTEGFFANLLNSGGSCVANRGKATEAQTILVLRIGMRLKLNWLLYCNHIKKASHAKATATNFYTWERILKSRQH
jgi:hypothetical protein